MLFFGDASEILTPGAVQMLLGLGLLWWWCPRWSSAGSKLRGLVALAFIWAWVFSTPAIANLALTQLEGEPSLAVSSGRHATLVVMGAGTPARASPHGRAQLNLAGWRRVEAAVKHWHDNGGKLILVGGLADPAAPQATSLAAAMQRLAGQWGVPDDAIEVAGHGNQNTREDLLAARAVLTKFNGQTADPNAAYLVTSAAHMPRAIGVANALGLTLKPMPTDWRQLRDHGWRAWLPNNGGPALWQLSLYELLGTLVYYWRGWL